MTEDIQIEEPAPRSCPLIYRTENQAEANECLKVGCAWFVRNGCAIFHLACSAIEWEKILRSGR